MAITLQDHLVTDSFAHTSGVFDCNGYNVTVAGNFTIAAGATITDPVGSTWTVGGNFSATGTAGTHLNLEASAKWDLDVTGDATMDYCDIAYCDAAGGNPVFAITCIDSGNNINVIFNQPQQNSATGIGIGITI